MPHPESIPTPKHWEPPLKLPEIGCFPHPLPALSAKQHACHVRDFWSFLTLFRTTITPSNSTHEPNHERWTWMLPSYRKQSSGEVGRKYPKFDLRSILVLKKALSLLLLCKPPQPILILIKLINDRAEDKDSYSLTYATPFMVAVSLNELLQGSLNFDLNWT